jgi:diguanylate cyclase (GGDEF)-like protein/PAS domain S-box-containing protein
VGDNERHDRTAVEKTMASRVGGKPRKRVLRSGSRAAPQPALRGPNDAPSVAPKQTEQEIQRLHRYIRQKLTEIEQVYQYSPVGLVMMDMDYRFVRINERMAEINGLPVEAHIGRTLRQVLPDLADYIMELYRPVYERAEPVLNVELHGQTRKEPGIERHWLANFFPFRSETGEVAGLIGAVVDITELKRQETKLRESEERFRSIFETVTDAIFVQDIETGKFIDINQRALDTFGYGREELLDMSFQDLSENKPPYTMVEAQSRTQLAVGGKPQTFEWRCKKKNGVLFWAEIGCQSAMFGGQHHLLSTFHDITIRKNAEASLITLSQSDALTGLANRGVFVTSLEHAIKGGRRRTRGPAVFYLDLDRFKDVNDTLGHPVGDRLLRSVAQRLRDNVRASDIVARFGGDEFGVLMPDLDEPADAGILAQKLVEVMEPPFLIDASNVSTSISIGVALYEPDTSAEALLSRADVALYRSKSEGGRTYRFFDNAMDLEIHSRVNLVAELREALTTHQLFLVYQPQVDLETNRIIGVEALVRWQHPTRGVLSPGVFIPAAERAALIAPLGKWVLAEACRQARRWLDEGIAPDRLGVNFSSLQLKTPGQLEREIDAILGETGLPTNMLELELTETTIMETAQDHSGILEDLRKRGVRIAIDDFGTGYSSLAYLGRFPVDRIKLAQEFIVDLVTDPRHAAIVEAAIGLARLLGIDMIAEGVETEQQLELLKSWGCRSAQGFYFAKPMPTEDVTPLLRQGKIDRASRHGHAQTHASR